ncbi:MAG: outer membrane protein transport protein [Desulfobacterales bacterium]|nr:outer membrane protein transport protein [Desulfobacterales bacterium]
MLLVTALAASAQAGGIINKQNLSADYIRTLNRNASTDMADAAVYNPAGTAMMQDGLYLKADAIYLYKDYTNQLPASIGPLSLNGGTLESTEPSIIPGLFAVYKQNRWSLFFDVTVPGGGGKVNYNDGNSRTTMLSLPQPFGGLGTYLGGATGNPNTINQSIEADSHYIGYSLGGAYKVLNSLSLSAGVRYVDANQRFKGQANGSVNTVNVKIEREDEAWNYFLGLDWAPTRDLNIGLTYMSNTPLNFKSNAVDNSPGQAVSRNVGWADGTHEREDLPGYVGLGVSYFLIPGTLRVEPNLTYYLEKQATFQGARFQNSNPGNSYDVGLTLEYILNPQWRFSIGYMHTEIKGMKSEDLLPEAPELDANTVSVGFVYSPVDRLSISLGALRVWYESVKTDVNSSRAPARTQYDKDVYGVALGLQYRFF